MGICAPTTESSWAMEPILERPSTTTYLSKHSPTKPLSTTVPTPVLAATAAATPQCPTEQSSLTALDAYAN
jgi:hypothetical protein